jgi:hypothetical protein
MLLIKILPHSFHHSSSQPHHEEYGKLRQSAACPHTQYRCGPSEKEMKFQSGVASIGLSRREHGVLNTLTK